MAGSQAELPDEQILPKTMQHLIAGAVTLEFTVAQQIHQPTEGVGRLKKGGGDYKCGLDPQPPMPTVTPLRSICCSDTSSLSSTTILCLSHSRCSPSTTQGIPIYVDVTDKPQQISAKKWS